MSLHPFKTVCPSVLILMCSLHFPSPLSHCYEYFPGLPHPPTPSVSHSHSLGQCGNFQGHRAGKHYHHHHHHTPVPRHTQSARRHTCPPARTSLSTVSLFSYVSLGHVFLSVSVSLSALDCPLHLFVCLFVFICLLVSISLPLLRTTDCLHCWSTSVCLTCLTAFICLSAPVCLSRLFCVCLLCLQLFVCICLFVCV